MPINIWWVSAWLAGSCFLLAQLKMCSVNLKLSKPIKHLVFEGRSLEMF